MYINELSFDDFIEIQLFHKAIGEKIEFNTKVDSAKEYVLKAVVPEYIIGLRDIEGAKVYYKKDGEYKEWSCEMLGFEKSNLVYLITLSCDSKAKNANSRKSFRLPYGEDMVYYFENQKIKGRYKDLSAGGLAFLSNKEHKIGDKIDIVIEDMGYRIELSGYIIRADKKKAKFHYLYGVKLEEINEKLMAFIFKKQSEIIRKRNRDLK